MVFLNNTAALESKVFMLLQLITELMRKITNYGTLSRMREDTIRNGSIGYRKKGLYAEKNGPEINIGIRSSEESKSS